MSARKKFPTRQILLRTEVQHATLLNLLNSLPLDDNHPLEVIVREPVKTRGLDANARMWVGALADISAQAYVRGRTYSAEVWHENFKRDYLPEDDDPDLPALVKDPITWRKWDYTPNGERVLIGSTTQLTKRGFSQYIEQVMAYGANLGVQFSAGRLAA